MVSPVGRIPPGGSTGRSAFGSYPGAAPHAVKVGIYRDVVLDVPGKIWIQGVCGRPYSSGLPSPFAP
jgi:hypothetical protein